MFILYIELQNYVG